MTPQSLLVVLGVLVSNFFLGILWFKADKAFIFYQKLKAFCPIFISFSLFCIWVFIFLIYKFPISGDVVTFFIPQGESALLGLIPNRDFPSSYMPIFPYIMGIINLIWSDSKAIGFFFTFCFAIFSFLFFYILQTINPNSSSNNLLLIGLLNSVIWLLGVGYQQDEGLILLLLGVAILISTSKRDFFTGFILGLILMLTKITMVIFWIPFYLMSEKKPYFLAGLFLSTIPLLGFFWLQGLSMEMMLIGEHAALVPPSLITLTRLIPPIYQLLRSHPYLPYAVNICVLGLISLVVIKRQIRFSFENILCLLVTIWLLFLLFSLKALTSYRILVIAFIPLILEPFRNKWRYLPFWFALYCSILSIHIMLYEDWGKLTRIYIDFSSVPLAEVPQFIILTIIEVGIVIFEVMWIIFALQGLFKKTIPTTQLANALIAEEALHLPKVVSF